MQSVAELAYYTWKPRPDQPERYDQQSGFYHSKLPGVTFLVGGNGAGTSETALAKVAKFLLRDQPPPRRDTPFWIISGTYQQTMNACWKEKLHGHGHIPPQEVDWDRVRWYKPNSNWPFSVPLLPWPDRPGKNWTLEFKSYEQGRSQMQAESIGGYLFVEQFPWGILEEVHRGCREYAFFGNKLCEFTPVDPTLSASLQEMDENDALPEGWGIFRANTECALEAGHVTQQWFDDFFGMVSPEMRMVRTIGAWGSFEGAIYQTLTPAIHFTDEPLENLLRPGMWHSRGLDWGFGRENAFCCLWGAKNSTGDWLIYDEYYSTSQVRTVHDHLKIIADQWPWPDSNPYYGPIYADPSDPGNFRIASQFSRFSPGYSNFNIQSASNRVIEGIEYVRYLLKVQESTRKPRLIIHRKNCPNLCRELKMYRWERGSESGLNPRDARAVPLKKNDHSCDALRYLVFSDANRTGSTTQSLQKALNPRRHGILLAKH